jgi:hypothetical protein
MAKFTGEVAKVLEPQVIFIENFIQQLKKNWMEWIQQEPQVVDMEEAQKFLRNQAQQASLETDVFPHVETGCMLDHEEDLPWFHFPQGFPWVEEQTTFDKLNHADHEGIDVCIAAYSGPMDQGLGGGIFFKNMVWLMVEFNKNGMQLIQWEQMVDGSVHGWPDSKYTVSDTFQIADIMPDLFE